MDIIKSRLGYYTDNRVMGRRINCSNKTIICPRKYKFIPKIRNINYDLDIKYAFTEKVNTNLEFNFIVKDAIYDIRFSYSSG